MIIISPEIIKKIKGVVDGKNAVATIEVDLYPLDPRETNDNVCKMYCWHSYYNLGDKHNLSINSFNEMLETMDKNEYIKVPLYLYDHSGITMSTQPFRCPWDSYQVGWAVVLKEDLPPLENWKTEVYKIIQQEVKEYDAYLTGNVYAVGVSGGKVCKCCEHTEYEFIDGCGGFLSMEDCEEWLKEINFIPNNDQ